MKEHKVATTMGLASLLIASGTLLASQLDKANINNESTYVQEVDNNITQDNNAVENNIQYGVEIEQTTEKTEEEMYHEEIEQALEEVMDGAHVHISVDQTLNNDNGRLPTDSQLENSWQNATPGAYYDQNGNNITLEQAVNNSMNGEETVVRMDNGDVPIGYIDVDQIVEENQIGMSR